MDPKIRPGIPVESPVAGEVADPYERYRDTGSGISPLRAPGTKGAVVKVNSYAHDTAGITSEDAGIVLQMTEKRLRKGRSLSAALAKYRTVIHEGPENAETAVACWGSVRGVCSEVCSEMGIRMVQPVVLAPFPDNALRKVLGGVRRLIAVEENATGQFSGLLGSAGIAVTAEILHCNGRPLTPGVLRERLQEVLG